MSNRRGRPLTSQAIGALLRNQLYAGIVDVPEYGVRGKRGDFEPLISEDLFYRAQAVLSGRMPSTTPKQRAHTDFPLRGFVRCASCGLLQPSPGYMRLLKESVLQNVEGAENGTPRSCVRSSRSRGSTITQASSKNST